MEVFVYYAEKWIFQPPRSILLHQNSIREENLTTGRPAANLYPVEETATFPPECIEAMAPFLAEFQQETDRAAAVLGAAYLENRLEVLLREKFVDVPKFVEELFHGQGGLSSFSAKISITYAIGLISKQA